MRSQYLRSTREKSAQAQRWTWEGRFPSSRDDRSFGRALGEGLALAREQMQFAPASVSVMLHGLEEEGALTGDLFAAVNNDADDRARWEIVSKTIDDLRSRFGGKALSLGQHETMPGGYVGGKIAFGRIPEADDFEKATGVDGDTHFCTF